MSVRTALVPANGTTLHVEQTGSGVPIVFVHGMCGDARSWDGQVARLSDRFLCVAYDRRGHSRSASADADTPHTVELHADDLAALIGTLDIAPAVVVGSSGGARVVLDFVRRHGHLARGAVLSEPPVAAIAPDEFAAFGAEIGPAVRQAADDGGPRAAVDAFFTLVCPGLWSQLDQAGKDRYRDNAPMLFADLGMPQYAITREDVGRIDVPTVVLTGTASHPAFRAVARNLAAWLTVTRCVELDCGHVTYAERPDEFSQVVADFAEGPCTRRTATGRPD